MGEARNAYAKHHKKIRGHDVEISVSGLVHEDYDFVSASPDGLLKSQCGLGLVEIKCPFASKSSKAPGKHLDYSHDTEDGKPQLKRSHGFYRQCQQQLSVTGRAFCDFFFAEGMTFME